MDDDFKVPAGGCLVLLAVLVAAMLVTPAFAALVALAIHAVWGVGFLKAFLVTWGVLVVLGILGNSK